MRKIQQKVGMQRIVASRVWEGILPNGVFDGFPQGSARPFLIAFAK